MADTAITELDELGAEKVSGVGNPANGTPWLLLKSTDVQADPESPHTESPEAEAQEAEMTKAEADEIEALLTKAEANGFCGVDDCEVCKDHFGPLHEELLKRKLRMADRRKIPKGDFAVPSKAPASGSYPINDESHARNALARASGKPVEAQVRAAVRRKYPNIKIEKMSPGVPAEATETPKEKGHLNTGLSGLAGPVTAGAERPDYSPSYSEGGRTPYIIPDEAKVTTNPPNERHPRQEAQRVEPASTEGVGKSWEVEVVDKQNWVSLDNAVSPDASPAPAPSVEAANTSVLDRIVTAYLALKEAMAAQKADPDGMTDPLDAQVWAHLEDVCATLKNALIDQALDIAGIDAAMLKAQDLLTKLGGADTPAGNGARTSEEENIMTTVTKEELASFINESSGAAAVAAVDRALKARDKAAKAETKKAKKIAKKNANNGGDITAEAMRGGVHGQHDAEDVGSVGGSVDSQDVNKEKTGKKDKVLKELSGTLAATAETLAQVNEKVTKMAARPRSGGPVLDGQSRGAFAASEGRQTETVAKEAGDPDIERLEKELEVTLGKPGPDNAARASDLGQRLTYARLVKAHEAGLL